LSQDVIGGSEVVASQAMASGEVHHSWRGRTYCWSESGWKGPGWYRCGFAARRGSGWGGPAGWHGWSQDASSDLPVKRRGSGAVFRSTATPSVAPLRSSRSSGGIMKSPLTNPSATSSGSLSGSGGAASSGSASSLSGTTPSLSTPSSSSGSSSSSTTGSGSSTSSSSSAGGGIGGR
jgi:hypothetical protein